MRIEYFQLIDRVVALDLPADTIRVEADVPQDSTIFEGHFPGHPLMPGVLLIEAMAQTSGWLVIGKTGFARMPFLAAVKEAKFRTFVPPGQRLDIEAVLEHEGSGFAVTKAKTRSDGKPICEATLTFRLTPFPNDHFREQMRATAERLGFPLPAIPGGTA
ncbi:MAG TPA: 3-hydroxyacyl-ACP dehydratase FabZ family protein [Xanthobacteraceae bacterium]|nr:3-hydroxyacyl-ACP dehydratase FabZ family protein [Xanthobacteraceae bacterium]